MKINNLIDRTFSGVPVLESIRVVADILKETPYIAIIGEDDQTIGIITIKDLQAHPDSQHVYECDITKPKVSPEQSVIETFNLMKEAKTDFLPVYEGDHFVGVISLMSIMERFVAVVSEMQQQYQKVIHDLRNPIGNVQGLTNVLTETLTDKESQDLLKMLNLSCKHAMDILDDLLFAEVDDNKPLTKIATEMNSFYEQCISEQAGLCLLKQIDMVTNLTDEQIIKEIDRKALKRAVQNVISNAIKFSDPYTTIKISSKLEDGNIILKILDTGVGIPEKLQPEIFKKFSPAQRAGTNGEPSTGLGLCFAKQCLEQHNGNIYFKSTEGKGTKFYISL